MERYFSLKRNFITKKTSELTKNSNCYSFLVDANVNKIDLKKDIESSFGVKVKSINIVSFLTKMKKKYIANNTNYKLSHNLKKAYIYLQKGEELNLNNFLK